MNYWNSCLALVFVSVMYWGCAASSQDSPLVSRLDAMVADYESARTLELKIEEGANFMLTHTDYHYDQMTKAIEDVSDEQLDVLIGWVEQKHPTLPAPVLVVSGLKLFPKNPQEGFKWAQLGYFKALYDSRRCTDPTSAPLLYQLVTRMQGDAKNYMTDQPEEYAAVRREAIRLFKAHHYHGSPLWICSHGILAHDKANQKTPFKALISPESEWEATFQKTIESVSAAESSK